MIPEYPEFLRRDLMSLTFPRKSGHRVMQISPLPVQG